MASPAPIPPPRPPRSLVGPAVLIAIGVLFLLANMRVLPLEHLGYWFARFWPLLLILWGVVKLIEHQQAQRQGYRTRGLGAGGILLIIVLVVCGLAASQISRLNWQDFRDQINIDNEDLPFFGHNYTFDDQAQRAFPSGGTLRVNNLRGAVNITDSDDDQIHLAVHKRINADNQDDADKWNTGTKPQITAENQNVTLNANNDGAGDHRVAVDMDISLPRKATAIISTRNGDVSVLGRDGDVSVTSQKGDVSVSDVTGKVSLSLQDSSGRISQVGQDVSIEGHANDISVEDVKGAVYMNGEFSESVKLSKVAKSVTFKSSRTDMEFARLDGDLDLDSGDLQANRIAGPIRLTTRSKDIRLEDVSGDVRLEDANGGVEVQFAKLGSLQVQNHNGDIQIYVPDKSAFQVDARAHDGEVQTDFSGLNVSNVDDQGTATGTVGGGGPHLVINNEHASIEIRKGSTMADAPVTPELPEPPAAPKPKTPHAPKSPQVTEN